MKGGDNTCVAIMVFPTKSRFYILALGIFIGPVASGKLEGLQNRQANLLLADTCGAAVAGPTHTATRFPIVQRVFPQFNAFPFRPCSFCERRRYLKRVRQRLCIFSNMVSEIQQVVAEYVQRVLNIPFVPPFSYERGLLRDDGGPNRLFFTFL